jgi:uncharacterized hydrophobic protein (TIGR00271 family)
MLQLRVYGPASTMDAVAARLDGVAGAGHVTRTGAGNGSPDAVVTADVQPGAADAALAAVGAAGVPAEDVALLRLEEVQQGPLRRETLVVWADLLGTAGRNARPVARYLVFMAVAGVIAAYGVLYDNEILIVGAMAVSPDLLPITATCVAIVVGRGRLAGRALWTLAAGLGTAGVVAAGLTAGLDLLGWLPTTSPAGSGLLTGLDTVNDSTVLVALVAGVAAILAQETRASSAVGVAISVTTIPASALLGVAAGVGELGKASGALVVLAVNVAMLVTGGTLTLLAQRAIERRSSSDRRARPR